MDMLSCLACRAENFDPFHDYAVDSSHASFYFDCCFISFLVELCPLGIIRLLPCRLLCCDWPLELLTTVHFRLRCLPVVFVALCFRFLLTRATYYVAFFSRSFMMINFIIYIEYGVFLLVSSPSLIVFCGVHVLH